mgnify:CR=1 FL=1
MRLKAVLLAAGLALAACSPAPAPGPVVPTPAEAPEPPPTMSISASSCSSRGGEMRQVGRAQTWQCVVKYADAGKRCTDASQCEGQCEIAGNSGLAPGALQLVHLARGFVAQALQHLDIALARRDAGLRAGHGAPAP